MFENRRDAGRKIADALQKYKGKDAIVLALPRGGVVTAYEVAGALGLPLDIVSVRKIGFPGNPEYAIGAVDETGAVVLSEDIAGSIDQRWLRSEVRRQQTEAKRRSLIYRGGRKPPSIAGKIAIIVDDGVATGLTMRLAKRVVMAQKPKMVIIAVPVASPESIRILEAEGADEVIVVEPPEEFMGAVGAHYVRFEQVEDAEVIELLRSGHRI